MERFLNKLTIESIPKTCQRADVIKEMVIGVEHVKLNTLEKMFASLVEKYRRY